MCRLYGFIANEPTKVDCSLVYAQNALMLQSRVDQRGHGHTDGWGIATYQNGLPCVEKKTKAAFADQLFSSTAERVYSKTIIAHVRKATVGRNAAENTHPFVFNRWTFAHNGTLTGFADLERQLVQETDDEFQSTRLGATDSEQYFLWLLSRIRKSVNVTDHESVSKALKASVAELAKRCRVAIPHRTPRLNFVLTDGPTMFACRWNNSLHIMRREGLYNCEICGIPHIHHHETVNHRAVIVASEPLTGEAWKTVPNKTVFATCVEPSAASLESV